MPQNMSLTNTKTGFSVKDILDLPDTNDEEGSITGTEEETEGSEATKTPGVLVQGPLENVQTRPLKNPFYDNSGQSLYQMARNYGQHPILV